MMIVRNLQSCQLGRSQKPPEAVSEVANFQNFRGGGGGGGGGGGHAPRPPNLGVLNAHHTFTHHYSWPDHYFSSSDATANICYDCYLVPRLSWIQCFIEHNIAYAHGKIDHMTDRLHDAWLCHTQ